MSARTPRLWRVVFTVAGAGQVPAAEAVLEEDSLALSSFEEKPDGAWRIEALVSRRPDLKSLARRFKNARVRPGGLMAEALAQRDWLAENRKSFPPLSVGRVFVHGSHFTGMPPSGSLALRLDAGTAFGSGSHESTQACLLALQRICGRPRRALDLGCGSGILAMTMARLWRRQVIAADIDPEAVAVTAANARRNGVIAHIRPVWADSPFRRAIARRAPYRVIAANILARPLTRLARGLGHVLARRGTLILSGLLADQEAMVLAAYRMRRCYLRRRIALGQWRALVIGRG